MHDIIQPEFICVYVGLFVFAGFGGFRLITLKSPVWMFKFLAPHSACQEPSHTAIYATGICSSLFVWEMEEASY